MTDTHLRKDARATMPSNLMQNAPPATTLYDAEVESLSVKLKTRSRQPTALSGQEPPYYYTIKHGVFFTELTLPDNTTQIVEIFTPGDIVPSHTRPHETNPQLTCASEAGLLWRTQRAKLHVTLAENPALLESVTGRLDQQAARLSLHAAMLSNLGSEQKLIAFLTELTVRIGKPTPTGTIFELPFRRTEIATYLGLNPDTVSRLLSRLRSAGLITAIGTSRNKLRTEGDALQKQCALLHIIRELEEANPLTRPSDQDLVRPPTP